MRKRLSIEAIKDIAKHHFVEALNNYDWSKFKADVEGARVTLNYVMQDGSPNIDIIVFTPGEKHHDPPTDYGIVTINQFSGKCERVEIRNLPLI